MIDLTAIPLRQASPQLLDFGGTLTPALGGPRQRIDRLGTRHAFALQTPQMKAEPDGRLWSGRLSQAKTAGALCWIPEPDLVLNHVEGTPVASAVVSGGTSLPIKTATAGLVLPEGKWLSLIHDGRRYLYRTTAAATVSGGGTATLAVFPMLRTPVAIGDVIEIAAPKVQGQLSGDFGWPHDVERFVQFGFTIEEDE